MFGYVIPDKPNLFIKDFYAFRAFYCGLCKATGKQSGTLMRFATNYDATILNILVHNVVNKSVEIKKQRCILHPFRKREMIVVDDLTKKVADCNTLLMYYKLLDNVIDGDSVTKCKAIKNLLWRKFKSARKRHPSAVQIITSNYTSLTLHENDNTANIDEVSDCFGNMMKKLGEYLTDNASYEVGMVFYCLGKWVYLIDALDDYDEDLKNDRYNPWHAYFGDYSDKTSLIKDKKSEILAIFNGIIDVLVDNYDTIDMPVQEGVLTNTFYYGLKMQTNRIISGDKKCQKTRL